MGGELTGSQVLNSVANTVIIPHANFQNNFEHTKFLLGYFVLASSLHLFKKNRNLYKNVDLYMKFGKGVARLFGIHEPI